MRRFFTAIGIVGLLLIVIGALSNTGKPGDASSPPVRPDRAFDAELARAAEVDDPDEADDEGGDDSTAISLDYLELALDLNTAAACLQEATAQLVALLRARPEPPAAGSQHDYAVTCDYLARAHQRYLELLAVSAARLTSGNAASSRGVDNDRYVAEALAASRRLAEASARARATLRSRIGQGDPQA